MHTEWIYDTEREVHIAEMFVELWTKAKSVNLQNDKETNVPQQTTSQALDREYSVRSYSGKFWMF